uniref:Uncharacterized protein n=1 Tax=viral metagenome TaxID=1070528 RepID=A0A6C0EL67_9ZZZZ
MDFKNKAVNHKFFDIFFLSILGFYSVSIFPINIVFTYLLTKAYLLNEKNLLNCFIIEFLGFLCLSQVYFINGYNYTVKTNNFKRLYNNLSESFPILLEYNPEMIFENLDDKLSKLVDNNEGLELNNTISIESEDDVYEVPSDKLTPAETLEAKEEPKNLKKMFFSEILKNPELISNMTKMVGSLDPDMINNFTKSMNIPK